MIITSPKPTKERLEMLKVVGLDDFPGKPGGLNLDRRWP